MKFPSYGLVYDYSLEDGGVSRKHSKDDDDDDHHTGEVRGPIWHLLKWGRRGDRFDLTDWKERKILISTFKLSRLIVFKVRYTFVWHLDLRWKIVAIFWLKMCCFFLVESEKINIILCELSKKKQTGDQILIFLLRAISSWLAWSSHLCLKLKAISLNITCNGYCI